MESTSVEISLDKLPLRRLDAIDENGLERFSSDLGYEEKRESLIRRIDFAWAVPNEDGIAGEEDDYDESAKKRRKKTAAQKSSKEGSATGGTLWHWQGMVENLQLAQQELSVIVDLINTVEANTAVTVAGMTRPKQLPNELLADYSISVATKLQCYRQLGKYFKRSAKALEQKVAREAKFYGALIRLQQNWKIKRQRAAANIAGSEGFTVDLSENSFHDMASASVPSALSTVRIDHDSAGMLAIKLPPKSCRALRFGFVGAEGIFSPAMDETSDSIDSPEESEKESGSDDQFVKRTHSQLREVHQTIFSEQVFEMLNFRAFNQSYGVNVTGLSENYLQLSIGTETSAFVSLVPSSFSNKSKHESSPMDVINGMKQDEKSLPNCSRYEIYLQQLFHENVVAKSKGKQMSSSSRYQDGSGLLGHFCMSLTHAIFAKKILLQLDDVVSKIPYLHLVSHQTWHSRTSSWTIFIEVPRSILLCSSHLWTPPDSQSSKNNLKTEFRTKIVAADDSIVIEAEGAANILGLFRGPSRDSCSVNKYTCDLANLRVIVLEQVASQVISWLHEEAVMVGMKASRDFLCLSLELEEGETLSLAAQVDADDKRECIFWWLVMGDGSPEERKLRREVGNGCSESRKFLGNLSLDVLYSTLIDLVALCRGSGTALLSY